MKRCSNNEASKYVNWKVPFRTNNKTMFGEYKGETGIYVVYSYGYHFPMYANINGQWHGNSDKYSRTTTRHQSYALPEGYGASPIIWHTTAQLKDVISDAFNGVPAEQDLG